MDLSNFFTISRQSWRQLLSPTDHIPLTTDELERIKSLNDKISIADVKDIYLPLVSLIQIYKKNFDDLHFSKNIFLQQHTPNKPFIIGISGSVAVGKSTTSRLLTLLLKRTFPKSTVTMVTTDGFLYPNAILKKKHLLQRKGFPESYDMKRLIHFLNEIKNNQKTTIPIYSHDIYDIIPNHQEEIDVPDILIIEGINVLQTQENQNLYISDYFDFSIYIDADRQAIERWYLERFETLLDLAVTKPTNYYYQFTQMPRQEALAFSKNVWQSINLINLKEFIEPTKQRAELILYKSNNHEIEQIFLKK
ncbi:type I pantothenate kinase [Streptococcus sp. sy004]|uniref:type I pantothenate kinase n=1 Tax=Streptococcus sp. sy004 TaxID=2600149 RepID=UPI0011B4CAD7|nr:type I pantothenate kinase [Streptococcus sp. sy004]TWT12356.1 type I pantothenate kinase [Streptococcus sp. sy004]